MNGYLFVLLIALFENWPVLLGGLVLACAVSGSILWFGRRKE